MSLNQLVTDIAMIYNMDWDGIVDGPAGAIEGLIRQHLNGCIDHESDLHELKKLLADGSTGVIIEHLKFPLTRLVRFFRPEMKTTEDSCTVHIAQANGYKFKIEWTRDLVEQKRIQTRRNFRDACQSKTELFRDLRAEYLQYAINTTPVDRQELQRVIRRIYERIGLSEPDFIWFDSISEAVYLSGVVAVQRKFDKHNSHSIKSPRAANDVFFDSAVQHGYHQSDLLARSCNRLFGFCDSDNIDPACSRPRWSVVRVDGSDGPNTRRKSAQLANRDVRQVLDDALRLEDEPNLALGVIQSIVSDLRLERDELLRQFPSTARGLLGFPVEVACPAKLRLLVDNCLAKLVKYEDLQDGMMKCYPRVNPTILSFWMHDDDAISTRFFHSPFDALELLRLAAFAAVTTVHEEGSDLYVEACRLGGWWAPFHDICILCDNPTVLRIDDRLRLHNDAGPALVFGGISSHAIHGVVVPPTVIEGKFNSADIDKEHNAEVRRVMLEKYGLERYLHETEAEEVHRDETGILYRKFFSDIEEPLTMVLVKNSTPEPDGTRRQYVLRVPPNMETARQAVAWTFSMDWKEYAPTIES